MARPASTALTRGYLDRLLSIGAAWPSDPLRPDLHLGRAIELAARKALVKRQPRAAASASAAPGSSAASTSAAAAAADEQLVLRELNAGKTTDASGTTDVDIVERSIAALERIRANKALKAHPTPRHILQPASHSDYYTRLVSTLDRAGRGEDISPSWQEKISRFFGRA